VTRHAVSVYEQDAGLVSAVADFLGPALAAGSPVLVVATRAHLDDVSRALAEAGIDIADAVDSGLFRTADAASLLEAFLRDGRPDPDLFGSVVGELVRQHAAKAPGALRVFGEMVALLWDAGNVTAALELEALWNGLLSEEPFRLLCGYPQRLLDADGEAQVCAHHDGVVRPVAAEPPVPGRASRRFEHTPSGARAARAFVAGTLVAWGRGRLVDAALVVVSELAGNAVRYAHGRFTVMIEQDGDSVRIAVQDPSPSPPQRRPVSSTATGGRGLHLIESLSRSWGTTVEPTGKTVWAVLEG
jgi:anti-sigma regulatory factor (Ser/Thr protein kinase)